MTLLGLQPSTILKILSNLESSLGIQLFSEVQRRLYGIKLILFSLKHLVLLKLLKHFMRQQNINASKVHNYKHYLNSKVSFKYLTLFKSSYFFHVPVHKANHLIMSNKVLFPLSMLCITSCNMVFLTTATLT